MPPFDLFSKKIVPPSDPPTPPLAVMFDFGGSAAIKEGHHCTGCILGTSAIDNKTCSGSRCVVYKVYVAPSVKTIGRTDSREVALSCRGKLVEHYFRPDRSASADTGDDSIFGRAVTSKNQESGSVKRNFCIGRRSAVIKTYKSEITDGDSGLGGRRSIPKVHAGLVDPDATQSKIRSLGEDEPKKTSIPPFATKEVRFPGRPIGEIDPGVLPANQ